MSVAFLPDLRASMDLLCAIEVGTPYRKPGQLTGVKDLNEEDEYVVVYDPQTFGDTTTTTTILLSDVVSVTLHSDVKYEMGRTHTE